MPFACHKHRRSTFGFVLALAAWAALACAGSAQAAGKIGIVLMHGEQGAPGRVIDGLGARLDKAGYLVSRPDMCWSARRSYESDFTACLAVVDDAIVKLRNIGATRIVVGGFSLGGNAAIAYGAAHPDLLGVFAVAPAHDAEATTEVPSIKESVAKAQSLVAQGKGDDESDFEDVAIGPSGTYANEIATTPAIYLSFFGAASPANIPKNAAKLNLPLLWVAGRDDPTQSGGPAYAFAKAAANPLSRYVTVAGGHLGAPDAATEAVIGWLGELAGK
jgi:pimeloyl-ACP methyl ester carboxylesterase